MINFILKIIFVISLLTRNAFCGIRDKENKDVFDRRKTNYKNNLITLNADCFKNGSILLTLYTSEPFTGSIYSRRVPSNCKTLGDGKSKLTKLFLVYPNKCGVQSSTIQNISYKVCVLKSYFTLVYIHIYINFQFDINI